jgi:hypothetical protein
MTKKEAEKDAKDLNSRDPQWFCPMINAMCRKDCVNFVSAFVESNVKTTNGKRKSLTLHTVDDEDFYVEGFCCSNAAFIGTPLFGCDRDE